MQLAALALYAVVDKSHERLRLTFYPWQQQKRKT
jgi:hypothetical protein